jgi:hypothetical protein
VKAVPKKKPLAKKKKPLISYTDALAGRKKIEKSAKPKALVLEFTEEMLVGMIEHGVVLDGFSAGIVKELILAWDAADMITTKHGKAIAKRIRDGRSTKRYPAKKKSGGK